MKKIVYLILIHFLSTTFALAGDAVGNGEDLVRKRFIYAYENIQTYLQFCLEFSRCQFSPIEVDLTKKILTHMEKEKANKNQLEFVSGKNKPGFFEINGTDKVAKTGDQIGSPIFINTDHFHGKAPDGGALPMDLVEIIAILIHEFGHHHGIKDEDFLDRFASKFQIQLLASYQKVESGFWTQNLVVSVLNFKVKGLIPQTWVSDGVRSEDLSEIIAPFYHCPFGFRVNGGNISNIHWFWHPIQDPYNINRWNVFTIGHAVPYCERNGLIQSVSPGKLFVIGMQIKWDRPTQQHLLVPGSVYLRH